MASQTHTFHIKGMHCNACTILTESEATELPYVTSAQSNLSNNTIQVSGEFAGRTREAIAAELSTVLSKHGYSISAQQEILKVQWSDFVYAIPIAGAFIALFIILQKFGIVNLLTASNVTYGTAFVIGLIASVSTCMAVVGGLVLSMSASYAKEGDRVRPQMLFHAARLVSFFVLGGLIGLLGSAFQLGATGTFILSFIVGVVLLILGINLLDVFPWAQKLQPTMPKLIGSRVLSLKKVNHTLTPVLLGAATFILPCGFTQSMQIYALSTGSFWTGAFTMTAFALGTLPVLALLSFSSLGIQNKTQSGLFFKSAGLVVIFFGVFNVINSLVAAGIISPIFNF